MTPKESSMTRWSCWLACACTSALVLTSCRGKDLEFDCGFQFEAFENLLVGDGDLKAELPEFGPYPITLAVSEEGVIDMVDASFEGGIPVPKVLNLGPLAITLESTSEPQVELTKVEGCPACVLVSMDFDFEAYSAGDLVSAGLGEIRMSLPLNIQPTDDNATVLRANYDNATVEDLFISFEGYESTNYAPIEGALEVLMTEQIREDFDPVEIVRFDPWTLGDGDVVMSPRQVLVFPEDRKLVVGIQTTLEVPEDAWLRLADANLPDGVPMGMQFHSKIFEAIARRMLAEGRIPRRYDQDGQEDPEGAFGVTLSALDATDSPSADRFDSLFRVWRIAEGYCGYAVVSMPMTMSLTNDEFAAAAGDIRVIDGEGSGAVAAREEELVEENKMVVDLFKQRLAENISVAMNYDALKIEGHDIYFENDGVFVTRDLVRTEVDFTIVVSE